MADNPWATAADKTADTSSATPANETVAQAESANPWGSQTEESTSDAANAWNSAPAEETSNSGADWLSSAQPQVEDQAIDWMHPFQ